MVRHVLHYLIISLTSERRHGALTVKMTFDSVADVVVVVPLDGIQTWARPFGRVAVLATRKSVLVSFSDRL